MRKKGLKITYIIETVMNLVNTFKHSSIHFYPYNLGLLNILGKGLLFASLFFLNSRGHLSTNLFRGESLSVQW